MKWCEKYLANVNDCDINSVVSTSGIQRYMQDCANRQMAARGPSYEDLMEKGQSFILSKICTSIYKPVYARDKLDVYTWTSESNGVIFPRFYQIRRNDIIIAEASSIWALIDVNNHRFIRARDFQHNYDRDEPLDLDMPTHIRIPEGLRMSLVGEKNVMYSDCDSNRHLHNTNYHDIICSFLPDMGNKRVVSMEVNFVNEAVLGDRLKFYYGENDDVHFVRSVRSDGKVNTESEIILENI